MFQVVTILPFRNARFRRSPSGFSSPPASNFAFLRYLYSLLPLGSFGYVPSKIKKSNKVFCFGKQVSKQAPLQVLPTR